MHNTPAVIGGSQAYSLLHNGSFGKKIDSQIVHTPFGDSSPIHTFTNGKNSFFFLSRHGETGYSISAPFVNYRANIWALKSLDVCRIISWSGPGIINTEYNVGDYVFPHDFIDETRGREDTFFKGKGIGFIRQSEPFCPEIKNSLLKSALKTHIPCHENGVYIATQGPRLETVGEIKKFKLFGGDMIGMTLVPEAPLSRELEMCYAPICYMTNFAEGITKREYIKGELFEGMQTSDEKKRVNNSITAFSSIIASTIDVLLTTPRKCDCQNAMLRYKKRGDIGPDWKTWIGT